MIRRFYLKRSLGIERYRYLSGLAPEGVLSCAVSTAQWGPVYQVEFIHWENIPDKTKTLIEIALSDAENF